MSQSNKQNPPTVVYITATTTNTVPASSNTRWRNRPQSNATIAGVFIFSSAGMNMALGLGFPQYGFAAWAQHFCYSWFIGVMIGTILSLPLMRFISTKFIFAAAGLLILIEGILFTSAPYNYDALFTGRYMNGIAMGLAIIPFLMHGSEIAVNSFRGQILAAEQYSITFGIAIQMICSSYWTIGGFPLHGIFDIVFGVMIFVCLKFYIESPVDLIRNGDDAAALNSLSRLLRPAATTMETQAMLEQHKTYVRDQENMSDGESFRQGLVPLLKMVFFRSMMLAFSYSLPLNLSLQVSMIFKNAIWAPTVAAVCRIFAAVLSFSLVDAVGRKIPSVLSTLFIGVFLISLGTLFMDWFSLINFTDMNTIMALYMVTQVFAGFFTPYTSVYLAEAFPLKSKAYLMAMCIILEQLLQIILIETINIYLGSNLLAQGIIIVVAFIFFYLTMPETRNTSLSEAQRRFSQFMYTKLK